SKDTRDTGPVGRRLTQMSSPASVASPIASRVPSGERDHPALAPNTAIRNVQEESIGVSRPVRSTHTISYDGAASVVPGRITSVPPRDSENSGIVPLPISITLSSTGIGVPFSAAG